jgi:hypothetical protein
MDFSGHRILRVVNNRLYPLEVQHPGLTVAEPAIDYGSLASSSHMGAGQVIEAVTAAGSDLVGMLAGIGPASFWARRRAHEAAVHLADVQLAAGRDVDLASDVATDAVDE